MSINAVGYENQVSGLYNIFGVDGVSNNGSGSGSQKSSSSGGDTVNISDEARELFSRKLRMLQMENEQTEQVLKLGASNVSESKASVDNGISDEDRAAAGLEPSEGEASASTTGNASGEGAQKSSGGGGGGSSSGGSSQEERKKDLESQLKSLQSQLQSIMTGTGEPDAKIQKAGPVENSIRTVEAELQALTEQSTQSAEG